jgi:ATP-dependent DNA helicase RecG
VEEKPIEFLKGVGPAKGKLLREELEIETVQDLVSYYPFRYEDRSQITLVKNIDSDQFNVQLIGQLTSMETRGIGKSAKLKVLFSDESGSLELWWFRSIEFIKPKLRPGIQYLVYGKPAFYGSSIQIAHPEIIPYTEANFKKIKGLRPVYRTTEKLKKAKLDSRALTRLMETAVEQASPEYDPIPNYIRDRFELMGKFEAIKMLHFPKNYPSLQLARHRMKYEELLVLQLSLLRARSDRKSKLKGKVFEDISLLTKFYNEHLPFELTKAQKKVIRQIYHDMRSGAQMNRLLQGDVGSGKTIVAFICMLIAIGGNTQSCLMAPTEILAEQHFQGLKQFADLLDIKIALLTGSTKAAARRVLFAGLEDGSIDIVVGTHALIEKKVQFKEIGLVVIDEQHRFGVAQRGRLWNKKNELYPHVLVMTATPIPRTLALTLYGDLEVSIIDELPKGRKPIVTTHRTEKSRLRIFGFIKEQIKAGGQVYIVYPLIEESEKLDYNNLVEGYESVSRAFENIPIGILHGRMKPEDKDFEMKRFSKNETKILVSTTVIEVGIDVPNANLMIIENAEKFGLSQLHQLRGRVGRGERQSYCILITGQKLSKDGRKRIEAMVSTNNGFILANKDLEIRGPGDVAGTRQSGTVTLQFTDLAEDEPLVKEIRDLAGSILDDDPFLEADKNKTLLRAVQERPRRNMNWSRVG